jgi:hypothetical protein
MAKSKSLDKLKYTRDTKNIWFPDQREPLYDPENSASLEVFKSYWRKEKERCLRGFHLADGKVYISGWLYWHTVYWKIKMKVKLPNGRTVPDIRTPKLRDIDWEAATNFEKAWDEGKFIELVGARGFGKTVWQASRASWYFSLIDKSQVVVSAGNSSDIKTVTDMISQGLLMLHPMFRKKLIKKDWKVEVQAGFKDPDGETSDKSSLSQIIMRNYADGNDSMAINGTRPDFHIIDEIGKIRNFIKCVKDSDGSYWANQELPEGDDAQRPTCLPMYTGTGGDMEVGQESAAMFFDPVAYNLLEFDDIWENSGKIGWFMPISKARNEYKFPKSLAEYLGIDHPDLKKIEILVSDEQRCLDEWWTPRYIQAKNSGNSTTLLSFLAYWPMKPSHSFLVLKKNNYPIEACKEQQQRLRQFKKTGVYVELYQDEGIIKHKLSEKLPLTEHPVKKQSKDTPIVIYEWPMENPPFGLYVAGVDPYRQGKAEYSDSLGAIYILKRQHSISSEKYQNMIVASYVGRPDDPDHWNEQARLLIKLYNARTLVENDEQSFIMYMKNKGDASLYLEPQPAWLKEITPHSDVKRDYGIHRSSERIRTFLHGCVKRYLEEKIYEEKDERGSVIKQILGVVRIHDPMLLEELIQFNEDGNFDREVAASLAFAMAEALDGLVGKATDTLDPRIASLYKRRKTGVSLSIVGGASGNRTTLIVPKKRRSKLFL